MASASKESDLDDIECYFSREEFERISEYEKVNMMKDKRNYEMMMEVGIDAVRPTFMGPAEEAINPEDSASGVHYDHASHISSSLSRVSIKAIQMAAARKIELEAKREATRKKKQLEARRRQLQRQLEEEEAQQEIEASARKAEEIMRIAQENAARVRRRQEILEQEEELKYMESEIDIEHEYQAAKTISSMYEDQSSVLSHKVHSVVSDKSKYRPSHIDSSMYLESGHGSSRPQQQLDPKVPEYLLQMPTFKETTITLDKVEQKLPTSVSTTRTPDRVEQRLPPSVPTTRTPDKVEQKLPTSVPTARTPDKVENKLPTSVPVQSLHENQQPRQQSLNSSVEYQADKPDVSILKSDDGESSEVAEIVRQQGNLTQLLLEHHLKASLPQRSIQPFTGDPLQYVTFIRSFEYIIEGKATKNQDRLYYLEQFTRGEANCLVRSCLHMKEEEGYIEAKRLLERKFGNKHRIAEAYLTKLKQWSSIKGDSSMHDLSLFLLECQTTMSSMGYSAELDSTATIRIVVGKLPYSMRDRWRRIVDEIEEVKRKVVKFSDLVNFIEKQARIETNPAYGKISSDNKPDCDTRKSTSTNSKNQGFKHRSRGTSFATSVDTTPSSNNVTRPCTYCNGESHTVENCFKLSKKPIGDRLKHLRQIGVCFGCLKKAVHMCKECTNKLTCKKCSKKHPTVLHLDKEDKSNSTPTATNADIRTGKKDESERVKNTCRRTGAGDSSSPCIIPVIVHSKTTGLAVETLAYMDNGSDAIFCTETLKQQLNVKGRRTKLEIQTMTDEKMVDSTVLQGLEVCDMNRENSITLPKVYTQEQIPADITDVVTQKQISCWPYLQKVHINKLQDEANAHIGLLIGNNVPEVTEPREVINSRDGGPYACRTLLGWTVHGVNRRSSLPVTITRTQVKENLDHQLVKLFNYDFTERIIDNKPEKSVKDKQILADVGETIRHVNGHYEIGLPYKDHKMRLPNNLPQAEQRAAHLKGKFARNPKFYEEYKDFMKDTVDKKYAESVPKEEKVGPEGRTWYIPHHGVYHPRKHKLRVVYDCAASYKGASLNKELQQGPDLTSSLVGVLMRFRQEHIALMSDIEGMFQQVQVPKRDRDLLRFLWWPEGDIERPLEEYRMGVHIFGATSSPACANYALRRTAEDASSRYDQQVVNTIFNNFYMDDCLKSVGTEQEAVKLADDLRKICHEGGFRLTKWVSNSRTVLQSIPEEDRTKEVKVIDLDRDNLPSERALGMLWSAHSDSFGFQIAVKTKPATRRGILSVVSSVYDPLGFAAPATLPAKEIMQDLCRLRVGWDDDIPAEHNRRWQQWIAELPRLENLSVNRCFKPPNFEEVKSTQLHHFSDASQSGYGTVSYLRMVNSSGDIHCTFVMGKSRVAPLKQITIPRLELTAATVAVRVNNMIHKQLEIPIDDTIFWTDSMTVLRYICNESARFHTFVANRIALIRDGSGPSQWRYVDTKCNPADDSSRGLTVESFLKSERWLKGPGFLWKHEEEWPLTQVHADQDLPENDTEVKGVKTNTLKAEESAGAMDKLLCRYSSWFHLKKAVAWLLKIKKYLFYKTKQQKLASSTYDASTPHEKNHQQNSDEISNKANIESKKPEGGKLSSKLQMLDMQDAERAIVQYIQKTAFPQEVKILESAISDEDRISRKVGQDSQYVKKSSPIYKLDPHMRDGILRVGGRLSRSSLPEETKHPVILPKESKITELILREAHELTGHSGRNHMLARVQKKYWIIKANAEARRVIGKCVLCRKQRAKVGEQKMADLPEARITPDEAPFTRVGVDYFGPIDVKRGRSIVKRYGVVFTCLAIRAVHIEKADTLETDSCISAIRRFIARRGQVQEIRSEPRRN